MVLLVKLWTRTKGSTGGADVLDTTYPGEDFPVAHVFTYALDATIPERVIPIR